MAKQQTFSIKEAISFGWKTATKNVIFLIGVLLIPMVISWLFVLTPQMFDKDLNFNILGMLFFIISLIIGLQFSFAQFVIYFKLADKKKDEFKDLFAYFNIGILWKFFLVSLVYQLIVMAGYILLIIPGIYFSLKYYFAIYIYIDKRTSIGEALKESAELTKGVKWKLLGLSIVQSLIMLAGVLALLVGTFVTTPLNYLSDIYVYRKLSTKTAKA